MLINTKRSVVTVIVTTAGLLPSSTGIAQERPTSLAGGSATTPASTASAPTPTNVAPGAVAPASAASASAAPAASGTTNAAGGTAPANGVTTPANTGATPPVSGLRVTLLGSTLRIESAAGTRDVDLGCQGRGHVREGRRVYVACGNDGVVRVDLSDPNAPKIIDRAHVDGEATDVFSVDGGAWVQTTRTEARPVGSLPWTSLPSVAPVQASLPAPTRPASGSSSPIQDGWNGETAAPVAPRTPARSLTAPPRIGNLWELGLGTRAFLTVGEVGVGALGEAYLTYRFDAPVALHFQGSPLGVVSSDNGKVGTASLNALLAVDTAYFEAGIGPGIATVHEIQPRSSFSLAQMARVGARDGLAFFLKTNVVVAKERTFSGPSTGEVPTKSKFELGGVEASFQIPLRRDWRMFFRGGGGPIGFAYGELGARFLVEGNDGPGSFALTGAVGGAGVFGKHDCKELRFEGISSSSIDCESQDSSGPSLFVGGEWRL